ncbi:MAG: hypothetical protein ACW981_21400 [Candidatus Hodarchaeales archaeon]|jgi:hypothetical protein
MLNRHSLMNIVELLLSKDLDPILRFIPLRDILHYPSNHSELLEARDLILSN